MSIIITHKPWCEQHEPECDQCVSSPFSAGPGATWLVQGRDDATPAVVVDVERELTLDQATTLSNAIQRLRVAALLGEPVQR